MRMGENAEAERSEIKIDGGAKSKAVGVTIQYHVVIDGRLGLSLLWNRQGKQEMRKGCVTAVGGLLESDRLTVEGSRFFNISPTTRPSPSPKGTLFFYFYVFVFPMSL